tara:strand:+ start:809 stop:1138 length:330 start_codon:yes stop_codon:yes gene_type:complete
MIFDDKKLYFFIIIFSLAGTETFAQYLIRKEIKNNKKYLLYFGLITYAIVGYLFYKLLLTGEKLAIANILWNAITSVSVYIIGLVFFHEKITFKQFFGCLLIFIGSFFV